MDVSVGVFCGLLMGVVKEAVPPQKNEGEKNQQYKNTPNIRKCYIALNNIKLQ